jgi:hypothetical protein
MSGRSASVKQANQYLLHGLRVRLAMLVTLVVTSAPQRRKNPSTACFIPWRFAALFNFPSEQKARRFELDRIASRTHESKAGSNLSEFVD